MIPMSNMSDIPTVPGRKRHCFKCKTEVEKGVKVCPKCGHKELGTGAPKVKVLKVYDEIPAEVTKILAQLMEENKKINAELADLKKKLETS